MKKDEVKERLKNGVVEIVFIKADESIRTMKATLCEDFLPPKEDTEEGDQKEVKPQPDHMQTVFDTEQQAWKRFVWARLKTVDGEDYERV